MAIQPPSLTAPPLSAALNAPLLVRRRFRRLLRRHSSRSKGKETLLSLSLSRSDHGFEILVPPAKQWETYSDGEVTKQRPHVKVVDDDNGPSHEGYERRRADRVASNDSEPSCRGYE
ncbi:hypothetical protein GW17_00054599 [Ensete ventricosum]|nr:hypothetical protein GW17_00054599 [Ensete ventricosum]